jgi:putative PEP-CTERM system histidine kinase
MPATLTAIGHGVAAGAFGLLGLWLLWQGHGGVRRRALALATIATALWSLAVATIGPGSAFAHVAESIRNFGWLAVMLMLVSLDRRLMRQPAIGALYGVLAVILLVQITLDVALVRAGGGATVSQAMFLAVQTLRMTFAIGALLVVNNFYVAAAHDARWGIRLTAIALAVMWAYDLNVATIAYLTGVVPPELIAGRGFVLAALAPMIATASRRKAHWRMRLSRAATFQSISLIAIGIYLVAMVMIARALDMTGGSYHELARITVLFGVILGLLLLLPSARLRSWVKVKLAKHLFQHRYDYRAEWMRFTETLGRPGDDAAPLDQRVVKAIADITESPGGLLLLPDDQGGMTSGARWRWPGLLAPGMAADAAFVAHVAATERIVEFDALRRGIESLPGEAAMVPPWLMDEPKAWAAVPLVHVGRLVGVVLLERPLIDRMLDWEDFDLLRAAGRQVASYLAEARGQEALSDAKRFDEFNRRFAFIMHDIKNLVSQLSLVVRNAERHADNPEFRADMIATLRGSVGKMNELLARLSQHNRGRAEEPRTVSLRGIAEAVATAKRGQRPILIEGPGSVLAVADPARLEQALGHLVQNAIDASPPGAPVRLAIDQDAARATIAVIDSGSGMSAEFLRDRLFRPFASTKPDGFGIGAYEARSLIMAMDGRLTVESREGAGSRFNVVLRVPADMLSIEQRRVEQRRVEQRRLAS